MAKEGRNQTPEGQVTFNSVQNGDKIVSSLLNLPEYKDVLSATVSSVALEKGLNSSEILETKTLMPNDDHIKIPEGTMVQENILDQLFSKHAVQNAEESKFGETSVQTVSSLPPMTETYESRGGFLPFQSGDDNYHPYQNYSTLDTENFTYPQSGEVKDFYESAANSETAEAFGLDKNIDPLSYFPYENVINGDLLKSQTEVSSTLEDRERFFRTETGPEGPGGNPGDPGTNPEGPGTNPGGPGTNPGGPGTNPGGPGTNPGGPGTNPEGPGTNPEGPGTNPGGPGTNPGGPGTNPGGPDTNPGGPGTNPDNTKPIGKDDHISLRENDIQGAESTVFTQEKGLLFNDTSPDGHKLEVAQIVAGTPMLTIGDQSLALNPADGPIDEDIVAKYTFSYNGENAELAVYKDGAVEIFQSGNSKPIFDPLTTGETATFSFYYLNHTVDSNGQVIATSETPAHVTIEIDGQSITTAIPDELTVVVGKPITEITNVLTNDTTTGTPGLRVDIPETKTYKGDYGTLTLNPDGTYTYIPNDNIPADHKPHEDTFQYTAINEEGDRSESELTITVQSPPVAEDNTYSFDVKDTILGDTETTFNGINIITDPIPGTTVKDYDADGAVLKVNQVTDATVTLPGKDPLTGHVESNAQGTTVAVKGIGVFTIASDGSVSFKADNPHVFDGLEKGQQAVLSFDYTVVDSDGYDSKPAHVSLTLTGDAVPTGEKDHIILKEGDIQGPEYTVFSKDTSLLSNDESPGKHPLEIAQVINPVFTDEKGNQLALESINLEPTDKAILTEYTYKYNDQDLTLAIYKDGTVKIVSDNNNLIFESLNTDEKVTFTFDYYNHDLDSKGQVIATSETPAHVTIEIDGQSITTAIPDELTMVVGKPITEITNVLTNDTTTGTPGLRVDIPETETYKGDYGTLTLNPDGTYTYQPDFNALQNAGPGEKQDTFAYTAINKEGDHSESNLTIKIEIPPEIQLERYDDTVYINGKISVTNNPVYQHFNSNNFPLVEEGVNISNLKDADNKPVDVTKYSVDNITVGADQTGLTTSFLSEGAGYKNIVGWYQIDTTGKISDVNILWANASAADSGGTLNMGDKATLGNVTQGEKLGFFLVADGYNKTANINNIMNDLQNNKGSLVFKNADGSIATTDSTSPHLWYVPNGTGTGMVKSPVELISSTGNQNGIYHTESSLNADGLQHSIGSLLTTSQGSAVLQIGFEDLYGIAGSDRDFNDVVFTVNLPIATTNFQQADSNHIKADFTDLDGVTLTKAVIDIHSGGIAGDNLVLQDYTVSATADADGYYKIEGTDLLIKGLGMDLTGTNQIEIIGPGTHAQYQDVVSNLHLENDLMISASNSAAGTRYFSLQITDEDNLSSHINLDPYIVTNLTAENTTTGTGGNDYFYQTNNLSGVTYNAEGGDDIMTVKTAGNTLNGGDGKDQLIATGGKNILNGGEGNDTLYTTGDGNTLNGGDGNDFLGIISGNGNSLTGGTGADVFHFSASVLDSSNINNLNKITDFKFGEGDTLDLSEVLQKTDYTFGNDISKFVQIQQSGNDLILSIDKDGTGQTHDSIPVVILEDASGFIDVFDGNSHIKIPIPETSGLA